MRALTAKATSGAPATPGCDCASCATASRCGPGISSRNTFGMPGGALPRICRTSASCTRNTVSVNITPTPSATTAACDWFPGRYRLASPCRTRRAAVLGASREQPQEAPSPSARAARSRSPAPAVKIAPVRSASRRQPSVRVAATSAVPADDASASAIGAGRGDCAPRLHVAAENQRRPDVADRAAAAAA